VENGPRCCDERFRLEGRIWVRERPIITVVPAQCDSIAERLRNTTWRPQPMSRVHRQIGTDCAASSVRVNEDTMWSSQLNVVAFDARFQITALIEDLLMPLHE
jgi:hypothetical protein